MKLIINADDLGFSKTVNEAIDILLSTKRITSATIMAGGSAINDVNDIVNRHPNASFGIHLCLDEIKPFTSNDVFFRLGAINSNGVLSKGWYKDIRISPDLLVIIYEEWKAQINYVISLGIQISHIDSHHHVHSIPYFRDILLKLSQEFGINKVRLPLYIPLILRKQMDLTSNQTNFKNTDKSILNVKKILSINSLFVKKKQFKWIKHTFHTTDFFCHAYTFLNNKDILLQYETIEIMCHPGHPDYQKETEILSEFNFNNIKLISYKDL